jgi:protein-S-isoprenylcysteine O-methyltransferase Ste14
MTRPAFKRWWTSFVPPPVERSVHVLVSSLALGLLFWRWRPIPGLVWDVKGPVGRWLFQGVLWLGWVEVFVATFLVDHFDLCGLRQVYRYASGRAYTPPVFTTRSLDRFEERDLVDFRDERYQGYQRRTRMLLPIPKPKSPPN